MEVVSSALLRAEGDSEEGRGMMNHDIMTNTAQVMDRNQKHQCHESFSATSEERMAPAAAPDGPAAPKQAKARFRFSPMENVRPMMANAFGMISAGPIP